MTDKGKIRQILEERFPESQITVLDDSAKHAGHAEAVKSGGGHFQVRIVSAAFEGRSHVERHRMIYESLRQHMASGIHAVAISAQTPSEIAKN